MPGSLYPKVSVDDEDNVFVFWGYLSDEVYYRYRKINQWSDIYCPYCDSTDLYYFSDGIEVYDNMIHLVGSSMSYNYYGERPQYYQYNLVSNLWTYPEMINKDTMLVDIDLSINHSYFPETAYRKIETNPMYSPDATKHTKKDDYNWSVPDLVAGTDKRQEDQQIAIDQNNAVHIVETQFYASSVSETQLVHYFKKDNIWYGQAIDSSTHMCHFPKLVFSRNRLYVVYRHSNASGTGDLRFSKYDIITNIQEETILSPEIKIYPNPGSDNIYIEFDNSKTQHIVLSIYDMTGKHITTLINETKPPAKQRQLWNDTDKTGKKVKPGLYLVRLKSGNKTLTQIVEILR